MSSRFSNSDAAGGGLTTLEQLAASGCEALNRPLFIGVNKRYNFAVLCRLDCKQWNCPHCSEKRRRKVVVTVKLHVATLLENGGIVSMVTLTMPRHVRTTPAGIKRWRAAWPKLRKRMTRRYGKVDWFYVPEQHKSGAVHIHLLAGVPEDERYWKNSAAQCGLGYIADCEALRTSSGAAIYVSKYMSKDIITVAWPKYFRRFNRSRSWPNPPALPGDKDDWEWEKLDSDAREGVAKRLIASGVYVTTIL